MMPGTLDLRARAAAALPAFSDAPEELWTELLENGASIPLPAGRFLRMAGDTCEHFPILLSGEVRVFAMGEGGREVTLYGIGPGEGCILTASCILNQQHFPAFARTRADSEILLLPAARMEGWLDRFPLWRSFVLDLVSRRLAHVIQVVEKVTFDPMDERIASHLVAQGGSGDTVETTHGQVAAELGTSREVVSRILKAFEGEGLVRLGRGSIFLADPVRLLARAGRDSPEIGD